MMGYELLDHTGDIGIKVWADDIKGIFREAALALFDIVADVGKVEARLDREIAVEGSGPEQLLVAWLSELLYLHEVEELLFCDFALREISDKSVRGEAKGEKFDGRRHVIKTSVKGVTYHQIEIQEKNGRWHAQVIFDI